MDEWPKNKGICSRLFQECEAKVQSEQDAVATGIAVDLPTPSTSAVSYISIPFMINLKQLLQSKLALTLFLPAKGGISPYMSIT